MIVFMDQWLTLTQALSRTMSEHAPGWTDRNDADPGITILEMLAFLAEGLRLQRGVVDGGAPAASRTVAALDAYEGGACATVHESWAGPKRTRFFTGRMLTAGDLSDEQDYHLATHRRHLRTLHGSGIVHGLRVEADAAGGAITIEPGIAIDAHGREIHLGGRAVLSIPAESAPPAWIVLEYAERPIDPVPAATDGTMEASRIEEGCRVVVAPSCGDGVSLARVIRDGGVWRVDPAFEAVTLPREPR
jgi:hypothetical protein